MAKKKAFPEVLDEALMGAFEHLIESVEEVYPEDAVVMSLVYSSFYRLTPQQQDQIIQQMGTEWYLEMAAKAQRHMRGGR